MSQMPADVEIVFTNKQQYKLHSHVLTRHSTRFSEWLTEANAAKLSSKAKTAKVAIKWRLMLTKPPTENNPGVLSLMVGHQRAVKSASNKTTNVPAFIAT